jgi:single-strand DNA-binding protein
MRNDLNRFVVMGHIGADPNIPSSPDAPLRLSIATSAHWQSEDNKRQSRTDWHSISVFGNLRKYAAKLRKGDRVYIEAQARNNNHEREIQGEKVKFYETEFIASQIECVTEKNAEDSES